MRNLSEQEISSIRNIQNLEFNILNWEKICENYYFNEDFIIEFQNKVNWHMICIYQKLSENFIRESQNKVYWNLISRNQKLSENFIR